MPSSSTTETRLFSMAENPLLPTLEDGRRRPVIDSLSPEVDGGRFPIKRVLGEKVVVEADVFTDGHDALSAVLQFRHASEPAWQETPMEFLVNDRWRAEFTTDRLGEYLYRVVAWVDHFVSWQKDLGKKAKAGQEIAVDLLAGALLVEEAARRARADEAPHLREWARKLSDQTQPEATRVPLAVSQALAELMGNNADRRFATVSDKELRVTVDPLRARFSAWYEFFPRSTSPDPGRTGTFKDCEAWLKRAKEMGFDVVYFPPIHPIGTAFRKGKNNNPASQPGEPGSPWGIGNQEGGHKAVHPELGTLEEFRVLLQQARALDLEVALDIAFQCSPDHPYVAEHPEWFKQRPDGTIQYAENPPKKYQDIYPFDFETEAWESLWRELKSVFEFWAEQGITIFRVDNPHTKAFPFWEWCIGELKRARPELIFLSEAFTRPKVMYRLAKLGFTQSYNYFPWRNTKDELVEYLTELTQTKVAEFFRPNLWPNTPDILTQYLQTGGRAAFMIRLVLAATLGASYGIYGPAFELCENRPRQAGSEEYLDSEKYEVKHWDLDAPGNLKELIARVNRIRHEHPALQTNSGLRFHPVDSDHLLAYTKTSETGHNTLLMVVNVDPHHTHSGMLELPLADLKLEAKQTYQMHDLLTGARYLWKGPRNYIELNPRHAPAHIFRLRQRILTEQDFDYFL